MDDHSSDISSMILGGFTTEIPINYGLYFQLAIVMLLIILICIFYVNKNSSSCCNTSGFIPDFPNRN